MNESELLPWFLAQVKPNAHNIAIRNLDRQGYQTFLPFHEVSVRRRGKATQAIKPLFPGYVFVSPTARVSRLDKINNTYGVSRLVSFGADAVEVPADLIKGLRDRCDSAGMLLPPKELVAGSTVEIVRGPFADFVATVEKVGDQQRVWVLLDVLGKSTRVSMRSDNLRSA
ncbi:transcription termination/antitermination protein NusG [Shimia sediminis]|uniref:transcription termination/antitermination protein NusG n=1 Tax=Shimia sediminis TaxID=2497945 RepID=UPI000F8CBCC1|nr:transcriptional activator RfaH [Shimia sediminis]